MKPILTQLLLPFLSSIAVASTIDDTNKYAWAANAGWINFLPSQEHGIDVTEGFLANYAWAANIGWIHLGDGTPDNGYAHSNTDGADSGVNLDSDGNLSGLAWSQNAAWINFGWAALSDSNRPRIDLQTGEFQGYVWAANLGWIKLGGAITHSTVSFNGGDGIAFQTSIATGGSGGLLAFCSVTRDSLVAPATVTQTGNYVCSP